MATDRAPIVTTVRCRCPALRRPAAADGVGRAIVPPRPEGASRPGAGTACLRAESSISHPRVSLEYRSSPAGARRVVRKLRRGQASVFWASPSLDPVPDTPERRLRLVRVVRVRPVPLVLRLRVRRVRRGAS